MHRLRIHVLKEVEVGDLTLREAEHPFEGLELLHEEYEFIELG